MPITYEEVLPWGRSFDEYSRMFALSKGDLCRSILGCGDGPAAFNARMHTLGHRVTSVDPLYDFDREHIAARIEEVSAVIVQQTASNHQLFRWDRIRNVQELEQLRQVSMREFLEDYVAGRQEGRYVSAELPTLPFDDQSFELALCSHFLFLYSVHLNLEFHVRAIEEMLRVADEVRIFPTVGLDAQPSPHLRDVMRRIGRHARVSLVTVDYEFQIGANQMLRIETAPRVRSCA
jgi:hypothetical protein